jgi:hypothetical protein
MLCPDPQSPAVHQSSVWKSINSTRTGWGPNNARHSSRAVTKGRALRLSSLQVALRSGETPASEGGLEFRLGVRPSRSDLKRPPATVINSAAESLGPAGDPSTARWPGDGDFLPLVRV